MTVVVLFSVFYALYIAKPVFNSSAKLMSTTSNSGIAPVNEIAQRIGIDLGNNSSESSWTLH